MSEGCTLCHFMGVKKGHELYLLNEEPGGYMFKPLRISYCPVCGRELNGSPKKGATEK